MKNADLYDYVVYQDNTTLAFHTLTTCMNEHEFLILMFHVGMKWACVKKSQDEIMSEYIPDLLYNVSN